MTLTGKPSDVRVLVLGTADWDSPIATNQHYVARSMVGAFDTTFVESIGLRAPRASVDDLRRIWRRLRPNGGVGRAVPAGLRIIKPRVVPVHKAWTEPLNRRLLARAVRDWRSYEGPKVLWTYSPVTYGLEVVANHVVYHCVDLLGAVEGIDGRMIDRGQRELAALGVHAIASSEVVARNLSDAGFEELELWPNVADTEAIGEAIDEVEIQREVGALFAGNLTALKIDFDLLEAVLASGMPLHLAGPVDSWGDSAERVQRLVTMGAVHHGVLAVPKLAKLSASLTLGLIPYAVNPYTQGVSPLKTYEYLRAGLAVLSTAVPSVRAEGTDITVVGSAAEWLSALQPRGQLPGPRDLDRRREISEKWSWIKRQQQVVDTVRSATARKPQHVLLTRFNVLVEGGERPTEEWLRSRLERFATDCLPSVVNQQEYLDHWLLFIDAESPDWFVHRLESAVQQLPAARLVRVNGLFGASVVSNALAEVVRPGKLFTTRLDNDDALSKDFLSTVQKVPALNGEIISFVDGAQLAGGLGYRRPYPSNPFLSRSARVTDGDEAIPHVFEFQHDHFAKHVRFKHVRSGHPMWLQVVHGWNLANEVVGVAARPKQLREQFPHIPFVDERPVHYLIRLMRTGARALIRVLGKPSRLRQLLISFGARANS